MKYILKLTILGAYVLFSCFEIFGQEEVTYNIKRYNVFNGLSSNWISDIFQDDDGFIWFATQYGLNRFDGQDFKKYTYISGNTKSLKANWVRSIIQSEDNALYIGTLGGGIDILNPHKEIFETPKVLNQDSPINIVNSLIKDSEENIWISSTSGAYRYQPKDMSLTHIYKKRSSGIAFFGDGVTLIAGRDGLFEVHDTDIKKLTIFEGLRISNIKQLSNNRALVYIKNELYTLSKTNTVWKLQKIDFDSSYISNPTDTPFIFEDSHGWIWVQGGRKLWRFSFDFKSKNIYDIYSLLDYNSSEDLKINCMFQDREGAYWIGTNVGAFQLIQHKPFRHPVIGALGKVREVVTCGNKMWFALPDGLYVWEKESTTPPIRISDYRLMSLQCASDGFLYGNYKKESSGVLRINTTTNTIEEELLDPIETFGSGRRMQEDANKRLWITQWNHILVYDMQSKNYFKLKVTKNNVGIIDILLDKNDNLWLATISGGLLKFSSISQITESSEYDFKRFLHDENNPNSISSNLITSLHQTDDGKLWIGTDGGLNRMDIQEETFTRYMRSDQMPDDKILNITSDKKGVLWLSTISHGITSFNPNTNRFNTYTTEDGLYDNSMLLSSICQTKDGYIWMGSEKGINYFHPDQVSIPQNYTPNLTWSAYTKHRKDTSITKYFPDKLRNGIEINPQDQNVSFQFLALTYKEPENVRYQFWLEGFHKDWLPIQEKGLITLSYLPKGNYRLLVRASNLDNTWALSYDPIPVIVVPPWYKTNIAYLMYSLFLLVLIYTFYRIQLRRKIAEKEKEYVSNLAEVKTRWFNQIAHEFRTPLTVILGAVDQIRNKLTKPDSDKENKHLHQIENQANHLSNQVHQILEIAQMQEAQLEIQEQVGDFVSFQRYVLYSFTSLAEEKEITLRFSSNLETLQMYYDEEKWRKITTNLISNAIKYNVVGGEVSLEITRLDDEKNDAIRVAVKDSGIGISSDFMSVLFDPFTRSQTKNGQGVGLGLTLTKELVELMNGNIKVESREKEGATFTIDMPIIVSSDFQNSEYNSSPQDESLPIVLVAEDHKEVQEYIQFCLSSNYTILFANNGQQAWELCQEHLPDLVISDIMMPKWNGIKLGTMIRDHITTDHIPLIFLTAKTSQQNQIEGLKTGADAYVAKPFDREELLIRVNHLIHTRKKLREKYNQEDISAISENIVIDSFMQSVIEIVKTHMDNDAFSIPLLAEQLHMSRVHLFRKIKNLTGMSPTKFIRKVRLQHARNLLSNKEFSIAEIAYQTGFKDPAYFTRVYVEEFGKPPSETRK